MEEITYKILKYDLDHCPKYSHILSRQIDACENCSFYKGYSSEKDREGVKCSFNP